MLKRSLVGWAGVVGVSLSVGCSTRGPTLSASGGWSPGTQRTAAPQAGNQAVNAVDGEFVNQVGQGNNAEIMLSQLAQQRASSAAGVARLTVPSGVSAEDQAVHDRLSGLSGDASTRPT